MNSQNDYNAEWQKVTTFDQQGLPKSAMEVVETIYKKSKTEKNDNQNIKALLHKSKYLLILEENAQLKIIKEFKEEITQSQFPKKNILENILANLYWQYFNQNRWKFYNRTKTSQKIDQEDFRTWDLKTLFAEIHSHYQKSIKNGVLAQQTDLSKFDDILTTQENSKKYRPTLYDFLLHNALAFYKTSETNIIKPAYAFTIDNATYLDDHTSFSSIKIIPKDSLSLQGNALKLYQNLLKFHARDKNPNALIEVNIERLRFVYENAIFTDKQSLLLKTLQLEKSKTKNTAASTLYDFEIAIIHHEQGNTYIPNENELHRWKLKEGLEICETAIKKFPDSRGAEKCAVLKKQILYQEINIKTEKYIPINTPARLLITYKNIDKVYLNALRITEKQLQSLSKMYQSNKKVNLLTSLKVSKTWDATLTNKNDYQTHTTEVLLPQLEKGLYLIVATTKKEITATDLFSYTDIQITNLALVENRTPKKTIFQVIDRITGNPIQNARVHFKTIENRGLYNKLNQTTATDQKGQCFLDLNGNYYNVSINVTYKDDNALFGNYYINQSSRPSTNTKRTRYTSFLFTDRSIYRPGQTVYFKGIMMSSTGKEDFKVLPNHSTFVSLRDVNGQEVQKLNFKTNAYGSYSGEFILPASGLTGYYTLETENYQSTSFSVEEYKRPKFETKFEAITQTYKINDDINLTANAKAYAGSNITDAKVVYRVSRKAQFPWWCYWYPRYASEPQEIAHGETTTDEKGKYNIQFKALPDPSVSKDNFPVFNYEVVADVTDINGETRSTTTIVKVGYHTMTASITTNNKLDKNQKDHTITINTANLNNQAVAATGTLKIYKLQAPSKPLRTRSWKAPDYKGFEKEAFEKLFPYDAFENESDYRTWKKGKLFFDTSFNTAATGKNTIGNQEIALGNIKKWQSGYYIIELDTKDRFGQAVKDLQYITLYSQDDKIVSDQQLFEITTDKKSYSIGDQVTIKLGSAAEKIAVTIDINKNNKNTETKIVQLSKNNKTITIPVTKEDLGGFSINYSFAYYNGYQNGAIAISVPYPSTELQIETVTFRDKLKPGQQETWSFSIKGPKGDKVGVELLASMYDMSLDQFKPHEWYFNPINRPVFYRRNTRGARQSFAINTLMLNNKPTFSSYTKTQKYDELDWFGLYFGQQSFGIMSTKRMRGAAPMLQKSMAMSVEESEISLEEVVVEEKAVANAPKESVSQDDDLQTEKAKENQKEVSLEGVKIRKNFQETAFFFPQLTTDKNGAIQFNFTAPEALTKWKVQLLAHTKELHTATTTLETVTQKELMILPNPPRFLRESDHITLSSKISNLSTKELNGAIELQLFDALTNKSIDTNLKNSNPRQNFTVSPKGNTNVSWKLEIPDDIQAVQYKIIAKAGDFSDGEQNALPVLSNRMLVTETLPMWIRSNQTKTFTLEKLKNTTSTTLKHHKLTLEMTSNPAWYAVQALPYLMEYPYECAEQTFSRYYANALASHIANSNPRIQEVFNQWKSTDALLSNLEKNQELKSLIIQETPWLRDAQSETEQKKRIALLFDINKMNTELRSALKKLEQLQYNSGGFPWFKGGRENRFITQHIATGFGHLKKLNVVKFDNTMTGMLQNAIRYLDKEFVREYEELKKYCKKNNIDINKNHLSYTQIHYLYMRSFFNDIRRPNTTNEAWNYYLGQSKKYWLNQSLYAHGLLALILERNADHATATKIIRSLNERSITSEELGMYWKSNTSSWYWYQAPIETQSLMIEAFSEIETEPKRTQIVDNLKIWLLKNKQTNRWKTTKATSDAVYALLLQGSDWISVTDMVDIVLGNQKIEPSKMEDVKVEAGTGYFKTSWSRSLIKPTMATAKISKKGKGIAWGALYWQYFENLDKITAAKTPLSLSKKLFLKKNTDTGEEITEITQKTQLQLGDLVRVRIELRSDRAMQFVHMKDMRAAGFEPINVLSQYKWQDGLGYYESTKDAATNFFFDYLPKGIYVFEYDVRVNNKGDFSNGITTIQSMYAPEFSSHSEGVRIKVN